MPCTHPQEKNVADQVRLCLQADPTGHQGVPGKGWGHAQVPRLAVIGPGGPCLRLGIPSLVL